MPLVRRSGLVPVTWTGSEVTMNAYRGPFAEANRWARDTRAMRVFGA